MRSYHTTVKKGFTLFNGIGEVYISEGTVFTASKVDESKVGLEKEGLTFILAKTFARRHLSKPTLQA